MRRSIASLRSLARLILNPASASGSFFRSLRINGSSICCNSCSLRTIYLKCLCEIIRIIDTYNVFLSSF
ncbi:secreted protein [methanotrophic bacterial endosymbiont of Bathymodiolus sp.]|nr:secreted protein [methanotrophic bacterial endosymbiont of Bathymodiolus sp.]